MDLNDIRVQVALVAGGAAILGAILGGFVGALGAWMVARMNRDEAREARFAADVRQLAAQLLRGAEDRVSEVTAQVNWRKRNVGHIAKEPMPLVGPDKPLWLVMTEVHLTSRRADTGDSAFRLWKSMRYVMDHFKARAQDSNPKMQVPPFDLDEESLAEAVAAYTKARRQFIDAMRLELRLPTIWVEGDEPAHD